MSGNLPGCGGEDVIQLFRSFFSGLTSIRLFSTRYMYACLVNSPRRNPDAQHSFLITPPPLGERAGARVSGDRLGNNARLFAISRLRCTSRRKSLAHSHFRSLHGLSRPHIYAQGAYCGLHRPPVSNLKSFPLRAQPPPSIPHNFPPNCQRPRRILAGPIQNNCTHMPSVRQVPERGVLETRWVL